MLKPFSEDILLLPEMLDLMVNYYNDTYETLEFRKPFGEGSEDAIIIQVKLNKYGRCRIGSEIFELAYSSRHLKDANIMAKFVTKDGTVNCYPGKVQYFFTHKVNLDNELVKHYLAYIRWYKPTKTNIILVSTMRSKPVTLSCGILNSIPLADCIISVHHILCQFVPAKYKISEYQNAKEYLAVNLINRKYNIH